MIPYPIRNQKMKTKLIILISKLFLITLVIFIESSYAQESSDHGFADYLFKEGEYYRAITEYYRLLYSENDTTNKIEIFRNIGLCYFNGASYEECISFIDKNRTYFQLNSFILYEMDIYLGKSYYHLGQYPKAITTLEWSNVNKNNSFFDETQFLLGISYARMFDWQAAIKKLQLFKQNSAYKKFANRFIYSKDDFLNLSHKSPFIAGTLSAVIPGTGYIYCDRIGTGLTSFIINALLIWTIRDAIINKQYGLATATSFFGIGWYFGNIKGSIDAAQIYNANIRNEYIDSLLEKENFYEYLKN